MTLLQRFGGAAVATNDITGPRAFKNTLNYHYLRLDHQRQLKKLNDVLVEAALSVEGLSVVLDDVLVRIENGEAVYSQKVPNKKAESITIRRNLKSIRVNIEDSIVYREYVKSLIFMITIVEDYIANNLVRLLCAYPRKILISSKGKQPTSESAYSVDFRDLLEMGSIEAIIRQKAEQRTRDAMYASPAQYIAYFSSVTGVQIDPTVWVSYAEIKATRDLYVHGDGTVNDIYIEKTGSSARYSKGEKAVVDNAYLNTAASCLKGVMSEVYVGLRGVFSNSMELKRVFDRENG